MLLYFSALASLRAHRIASASACTGSHNWWSFAQAFRISPLLSWATTAKVIWSWNCSVQIEFDHSGWRSYPNMIFLLGQVLCVVKNGYILKPLYSWSLLMVSMRLIVPPLCIVWFLRFQIDSNVNANWRVHCSWRVFEGWDGRGESRINFKMSSWVDTLTMDRSGKMFCSTFSAIHFTEIIISGKMKISG